MAGIIGLSGDLLTGYYAARRQQSLLLSGASAAPPGIAPGGAADGSQVRPPWDVRNEITGLEELSREALGAGIFFKSSEYSELEAPQDHKDLFALHQGLRRMYALASEAADDTTSDFRRDFLNRRFGEGLSQLGEFVDGLDLEGLNIVSRSLLDRAETDLAIRRGVSEYVTGIVHSGAFDAAVTAFQGDVRFSINVTKNGVETPIQIDLADMGGQTRNLDNVAAFINAKLEAAGMVTRFERVKIGEEDDSGVIPGDDFGFRISGVSTEKVRFDADGSAAAYVVGLSGETESAAGQVSKLEGLAGTPAWDFIRRFEADSKAAETEPMTPEERVEAKQKELAAEQGEEELKPWETGGTEEEFSAALKARSVVTAPGGEIYVLAETNAPVSGAAIKGESDLILARYDSTGKQLWTRNLGAAEAASGTDLAVDAQGGVVLTGTLTGALGDTLDRGEADAFVAKYSAEGEEQWLQRYGTTGADGVSAVTVGDDGTVYLAGTAPGGIDGEPGGGGKDAYIRAMSADGELLWTRQFGGAGDQEATAIALDAAGNVIIGLKGETGAASVTSFPAADGDSPAQWTHDLGDLNGGEISALGFDDTGALFVAGSAGGASALAGAYAGHAGSRDGFVMKLSGDGAARGYVKFLGTETTDQIRDMRIAGGSVYLTGVTSGAMPGGGALTGSRNTFVSSLSTADGAVNWTQQLSGRGGLSEGASLAIDAKGDSVLDKLGLPRGTLDYGGSQRITDHSAVRAGDSFRISVDGGYAKKIEIQADDTYLSLSFKINAALVLDGKAEMARSSEGGRLRITPREGVTIEIIGGPEGRDALKALGLSEGVVHDAPKKADEESVSDAPPLYGLGVDFDAMIATEAGAKNAAKMLSEAMQEIQKAYRELTSPRLDTPQGPGKRGGEVPAYLQARLANFQAGLNRLSAGGGASAGTAGLLL